MYKMSLDSNKLWERLDKNPNPLLKELLKKISDIYWIKINSLKKLVEAESKKWLEWLKSQISSIENSNERELLNNLSRKELERLFFALEHAHEIISKTSEENIKNLKKQLEKDWFFPEKYFYLSNKFLSQNLIASAKNPKNVYEHILWACLWSINSIEKVVTITIELLIWIWKWIYDLYLIAIWKWKYDNFKKI